MPRSLIVEMVKRGAAGSSGTIGNNPAHASNPSTASTLAGRPDIPRRQDVGQGGSGGAPLSGFLSRPAPFSIQPGAALSGIQARAQAAQFGPAPSDAGLGAGVSSHGSHMAHASNRPPSLAQPKAQLQSNDEGEWLTARVDQHAQEGCGRHSSGASRGAGASSAPAKPGASGSSAAAGPRPGPAPSGKQPSHQIFGTEDDGDDGDLVVVPNDAKHLKPVSEAAINRSNSNPPGGAGSSAQATGSVESSAADAADMPKGSIPSDLAVPALGFGQKLGKVLLRWSPSDGRFCVFRNSSLALSFDGTDVHYMLVNQCFVHVCFKADATHDVTEQWKDSWEEAGLEAWGRQLPEHHKRLWFVLDSGGARHAVKAMEMCGAAWDLWVKKGYISARMLCADDTGLAGTLIGSSQKVVIDLGRQYSKDKADPTVKNAANTGADRGRQAILRGEDAEGSARGSARGAVKVPLPETSAQALLNRASSASSVAAAARGLRAAEMFNSNVTARNGQAAGTHMGSSVGAAALSHGTARGRNMATMAIQAGRGASGTGASGNKGRPASTGAGAALLGKASNNNSNNRPGTRSKSAAVYSGRGRVAASGGTVDLTGKDSAALKTWFRFPTTEEDAAADQWRREQDKLEERLASEARAAVIASLPPSERPDVDEVDDDEILMDDQIAVAEAKKKEREDALVDKIADEVAKRTTARDQAELSAAMDKRRAEYVDSGLEAPADDQLKAEVQKALKEQAEARRKRLVRSAVTITGGDVERLKPRTYLIDGLIDWWLQLLRLQLLGQAKASSFIMFSSFLYKKMRNVRHSWTRPVTAADHARFAAAQAEMAAHAVKDPTRFPLLNGDKKYAGLITQSREWGDVTAYVPGRDGPAGVAGKAGAPVASSAGAAAGSGGAGALPGGSRASSATPTGAATAAGASMQPLFYMTDVEKRDDIVHKGVHKWTKHVDVFKAKVSIMSVCYGDHWSLVALVNMDRLGVLLQELDRLLRKEFTHEPTAAEVEAATREAAASGGAASAGSAAAAVGAGAAAGANSGEDTESEADSTEDEQEEDEEDQEDDDMDIEGEDTPGAAVRLQESQELGDDEDADDGEEGQAGGQDDEIYADDDALAAEDYAQEAGTGQTRGVRAGGPRRAPGRAKQSSHAHDGSGDVIMDEGDAGASRSVRLPRPEPMDVDSLDGSDDEASDGDDEGGGQVDVLAQAAANAHQMAQPGAYGHHVLAALDELMGAHEQARGSGRSETHAAAADATEQTQGRPGRKRKAGDTGGRPSAGTATTGSGSAGASQSTVPIGDTSTSSAAGPGAGGATDAGQDTGAGASAGASAKRPRVDKAQASATADKDAAKSDSGDSSDGEGPPGLVGDDEVPVRPSAARSRAGAAAGAGQDDKDGGSTDAEAEPVQPKSASKKGSNGTGASASAPETSGSARPKRTARVVAELTMQDQQEATAKRRPSTGSSDGKGGRPSRLTSKSGTDSNNDAEVIDDDDGDEAGEGQDASKQTSLDTARSSQRSAKSQGRKGKGEAEAPAAKKAGSGTGRQVAPVDIELDNSDDEDDDVLFVDCNTTARSGAGSSRGKGEDADVPESLYGLYEELSRIARDKDGVNRGLDRDYGALTAMRKPFIGWIDEVTAELFSKVNVYDDAPCIVGLDSLRMHDVPHLFDLTANFLLHEFVDKKNGGQPVGGLWRVVHHRDLMVRGMVRFIQPRAVMQTNGWDCGVFLLRFTESLCHRLMLGLSVSQADLDRATEEVANTTRGYGRRGEGGIEAMKDIVMKARAFADMRMKRAGLQLATEANGVYAEEPHPHAAGPTEAGSTGPAAAGTSASAGAAASADSAASAAASACSASVQASQLSLTDGPAGQEAGETGTQPEASSSSAATAQATAAASSTGSQALVPATRRARVRPVDGSGRPASLLDFGSAFDVVKDIDDQRKLMHVLAEWIRMSEEERVRPTALPLHDDGSVTIANPCLSRVLFDLSMPLDNRAHVEQEYATVRWNSDGSIKEPEWLPGSIVSEARKFLSGRARNFKQHEQVAAAARKVGPHGLKWPLVVLNSWLHDQDQSKGAAQARANQTADDDDDVVAVSDEKEPTKASRASNASSAAAATGNAGKGGRKSTGRGGKAGAKGSNNSSNADSQAGAMDKYTVDNEVQEVPDEDVEDNATGAASGAKGKGAGAADGIVVGTGKPKADSIDDEEEDIPLGRLSAANAKLSSASGPQTRASVGGCTMAGTSRSSGGAAASGGSDGASGAPGPDILMLDDEEDGDDGAKAAPSGRPSSTGRLAQLDTFAAAPIKVTGGVRTLGSFAHDEPRARGKKGQAQQQPQQQQGPKGGAAATGQANGVPASLHGFFGSSTSVQKKDKPSLLAGLVNKKPLPTGSEPDSPGRDGRGASGPVRAQARGSTDSGSVIDIADDDTATDVRNGGSAAASSKGKGRHDEGEDEPLGASSKGKGRHDQGEDEPLGASSQQSALEGPEPEGRQHRQRHEDDDDVVGVDEDEDGNDEDTRATQEEEDTSAKGPGDGSSSAGSTAAVAGGRAMGLVGGLFRGAAAVVSNIYHSVAGHGAAASGVHGHADEEHQERSQAPAAVGRKRSREEDDGAADAQQQTGAGRVRPKQKNQDRVEADKPAAVSRPGPPPPPPTAGGGRQPAPKPSPQPQAQPQGQRAQVQGKQQDTEVEDIEDVDDDEDEVDVPRVSSNRPSGAGAAGRGPARASDSDGLEDIHQVGPFAEGLPGKGQGGQGKQQRKSAMMHGADKLVSS